MSKKFKIRNFEKKIPTENAPFKIEANSSCKLLALFSYFSKLRAIS